MKPIYLGIIILFLILSASAVYLISPKNGSEKIQNPPVLSTPKPASSTSEVNFQASFNIITFDIKRSFKATKYHNQSEDVFLTSDDPTIVHVKKAVITWQDFFDTLPMKLTKDCLTTGDGEKYCTGQQGVLKFELNNQEDKNLLDKEIKDGDKVLIQFRSS